MDKKDLDFLKAELAQLTVKERRKLMDEAAHARREATDRAMRKRLRRMEEDDEGMMTIRKREVATSLDDWMLKILRGRSASEGLSTANIAGPIGTVIEIQSGRCEVIHKGERLVCPLAADIVAHQQSLIAVGDRVELESREEHLWVRGVLPRATKLSRPDPSRGTERVIVANIDVVVVVVSIGTPPLHPRLIDRYLIAIHRGGAIPMICVNKVDLMQHESELDVLLPYADLAPVIRCSTVASDGMGELHAELRGKTSAFVGHSGVGKSSLLNALSPDIGTRVGEVSATYGRGKHTTTSSHLWDLGDETFIIDTPGVRSFGLFDLRRDELPIYFAEFTGFPCKFRDCSHTHEPECGVVEAMRSGAISKDRYDTYCRILRSLKD